MLKQQNHVIFFFLLTLISALWMTEQNYSEFNVQELVFLSVYMTSVLLVQLSLITLFLLCRKFSAHFDKASKVLAAVFSVANIYTLVLLHNGHIARLNSILSIVLLLVAGLLFSFLFLYKNDNFTKAARVFLIVLTVSIGGQFLFKYTVPVDGFLKKIPDHFRSVTFKDRPNIYVISFDAMVPAAIASQIIGVDDVSYIDEIEEFGGRILPNSFAERVPTKRSLSIFLAMDVDYYDTVRKKTKFIRDHVPNPTYEILRDNGYKIQFVYSTSYFGDDKGRLDHYAYARLNPCKHIEKPYALMGFCFDAVQNKFQKHSDGKQWDYPELLFERIKQVSQSEEPWFTFSYIYEPGHAKNSFDPYSQEDKEEYKAYYALRVKKAAETLHTLLDTLRTHDPDALVFIFGDHGAMTSNGLSTERDKLPDDSPLTHEQVIQDKHAVLAAVFPADFCEDSVFVENPFSTVRIMRDIMKCLSHGEDPLPADFQTHDENWLPYIYE